MAESPWARLFVGNSAHALFSGDVTVTGTFSNPSDKNLKKNIIGIGHALEKIRRIKGIYYSWVDKSDCASDLHNNELCSQPLPAVFDKKRHVGVIAQDVEAVLPEAVSQIFDGRFLGVNYAEIVPLLIEGIKEQQAEIEQQKSDLISQQEELVKQRVELKDLRLQFDLLAAKIERMSLEDSKKTI